MTTFRKTHVARSRRFSRFPLNIAVIFSWLVLALPGQALADIAIIVSRDNPVTSLSEDEVRQIFLGRVRQFPSTQRNVEPVDQEAALPIYQNFYRATAHLTPQALERLRSMYLFSGKGLLPKMLGDDAAVIAYVAKHGDAIGYVHAGQLGNGVKTVLIIQEKN